MSGIVGVGVDIIEIERIKAAIQRQPRLVSRVFTAEERAHFAGRGAQTVAGCFAAKEAAVKATGGGALSDASLTWDENGKPSLTMRGRDDLRFFVSISHSRGHAVATVTAVVRE
ncbi:holo-[acyl-carrier-protein] synthase [Clostridia bacterium]|nr:holo-[acyl-carrier-protein] synthase [Clostridia bacterium]